MGWLRRGWEEGAPIAVKPEVVYETHENWFIDGITWTRGNQQYLRTKCLICSTRMGTCRGRIRFEEIKRDHRKDCPAICGFNDCFDCGET